MALFEHKFVNAATNQASNYDRRYRKRIPFAEIVDALRRQAAFDMPLRFVRDSDPDLGGLFKRDKGWDFGDAGVSFAKADADGASPTLMICWSDEAEQKTLQVVLDELAALGFEEGAEVSIELVSPEGERLRSRYGASLSVKDGTTVHISATWQQE